MPDYAYVAIDPAGHERRGTISTISADAAHSALVARRWFVVRVTEREHAGAGEGGRTVFARAKRLSPRELMLVTRQLSTLAQVSPLEEALHTITRQSERAHVRHIVAQVHGGVVEGRSLAEAMALEPRSFPALYRAMVAAGERSGSLPQLTDRLSLLLERQAVVRSKMLSALAYPAVLALFAIIVTMALMIFVVPLVVEQFDTLDQQLPLLTRIVMGLSLFLARWWWLMLILIALAGVAVWVALRRDAVRMRCDALMLRLPIAGRLIRDLHAARMARTLATMLQSRLPVVEGLNLTVPTVHNRVLRAATSAIVQDVRGGGSLSAALRRAGVFPPILVYLAASGESAGRLDAMLERAAEYLEREFDSFATTAMALMEPIIIILLGGVVALIILSILLPIMQLQSLTGIGR